MSQKKPESGGEQSKQEEKQPPKELEKLKKSVEKIETSLLDMHKQKRQPLFMQEQAITSKQPQTEQKGMEQQGSDGQSSSGQGGGQEGSQGGGSQGGQSSQGGQGGTQQKQQPEKLSPEELKKKLDEQTFMKFDSMKADIMDLNSTWNSYEPKAIAALAPQASVTTFENIINNLTKAVGDMNEYQALVEVNGLYKYLPDFYSLYKSKTPPDLDRMRYAVKQIPLVCEKKNFDVAMQLIAYMEKVWSDAKPKLQKDNMESMNKFEFALADLKNAIASKDGTIIEAKLKVVEGVIDEMEKKGSKESQ